MRRLRLVLAGAVLGTLMLAPATAQAQPAATNTFTDIPLTLTGTFANGVAGTFTGNLDITRFAVRNGQIVAIGNLDGTVTQTIGGVTTVVGTLLDFPVTIPVTFPTASCEILELVLGPLHLDLLGLVVDLNQVELLITAVPGAGNLLGNLLCAVAGLLDGGLGGALNGIAALLNQLLRIFG